MTSIGRLSYCPRLPLLLLAGLLASPVVAHAETTIRQPHDLPVELLRPAPGEVLEGGGEATIAWRLLDRPMADHIEEWEAFLSLDGGRHWPVRITPHLDIDVTSFRFVVPLAPSDEVRIMLRFGDERDEVGYVLPGSFRTVMPAVAPVSNPSPSPAFERGEVAQPGVPGVVLWTDGDRAGAHTRLRASAVLPATLKPSHADRTDSSPAAVLSDRRTPDGSAEDAGPLGVAAPAGSALPSPHSHDPQQPILLLLCRQNE